MRTRSATAVEIGSETIRVVEFTRGLRGLAVNVMAAGTRPKSEDEAALADALKRVLASGAFSTQTVVTVIPRHLATVRMMNLPTRSEDELKAMLAFEAERHLPFRIADVELDFVRLGDDTSGGSEIVLVAIQKEVVNKHLGLLRSAGLEPERIDVSCLAIYNTFLSQGAFAPDAAVAVMDVGARFSEVLIVENQKLRFTRSAPLGGAHLTEELSRTLGAGPDECDALKKEFGLSAPEGSAGTRVTEVARQWAVRLGNEIRRSLDAFRSERRDATVGRILVTGGGGNLKGLPEFLAGELGLEVTRGNPLQGISVRPREYRDAEAAGGLAVAVGLALGDEVAGGLGVNLFPVELRREEAERKRRLAAVVCFVAAAVIIAAALAYFSVRVRSAQNELAAVLKEIEAHQGVALDRVEKQIALVKDYGQEGVTFLEMQNVLSLVTPPDVLLVSVGFLKHSRVEVLGRAKDLGGVRSLQRLLRETGYFADIAEQATTVDPASRMVKFGLVCYIEKGR